ncbi:Oxygen-independent coproporphyrinogen-III oxidase 1 [Candidatus Xiphinematobacter sp. Idaho Grape]|uniref:radical SAM family heme chaperone HemW n=1 Tax=Candidatus Xiphinematobacter sp. Idaho Grape TaxID=1704307 RepID=UPI00070652C3|nr:radical SAM family heme chaperone HemW [Candidatus Xiphinematobacter sp. Idaho Grape]ALJ56618.1 Oxygen-independent coproporphyrinogen-III oxidase 1 [Candidatus Xiphinematobacter sp. Idaho Grape]
MVRNLYIHIPFCSKICPYCSFYKEQINRNRIYAFLDALLMEAKKVCFQPEAVFFGGGTPTVLSCQQLDYLLRGLSTCLDLRRVKEWTVEMNPATVSAEKGRLLLDWGVNRISMGVQSWDPGLLAVLGREHTTDQSKRSYDILREVGFSNINLDLIFGIPGQGIEQWRDSLSKTVLLRPDHISAYCLTYKEDTEYFFRLMRGVYSQDVDKEAEFFEVTMNYLEEVGYCQYEISNYTSPGKECLHNLGYWRGEDYIGLGPSAFSTVGTLRWNNVADTVEYIKRMNTDGEAVHFRERLSPATLRTERVLLSLRTREGVPAHLLREHEERLQIFFELGLIEASGETIRLTRQGCLVADSVAEAFL